LNPSVCPSSKTRAATSLVPVLGRLVAGAALLAAGLAACGGEAGRVSSVADASKARLESLLPIPLSEIAARPVDLARFTHEEVWNRIQASNDQFPDGRADLPWLVEVPTEGDAASGIPGPEARYWSAILPATVDVNLGRTCYVCEVVVQPDTYLHGLSGFKLEVKLVDEDGTERPTDPRAQGVLTAQSGIAKDRRGLPLALRFPPRSTQKMKLEFTAAADTQNNRIYIERIRVLGKPVWAPGQLTPGLVPPEKADEADATNLAAFDLGTAQTRVKVSEDRHPVGRAELPVSTGDAADAARDKNGPYWCAAAPAWYDVDLGDPCIVTEARVYPFDPKYGAPTFYMKVVQDDGTESDTVPPCTASVLPEAGSDTDALTASFEPAPARRVRFYFPVSASPNGLLYVKSIQVLGTPEEE